MKKHILRAFAVVCLLTAGLFGQSTTVTATLKSLTGTPVTSGAYMQFTLKAFNGNPVRVNGQNWVTTKPIVARPDAYGNLSTPLQGNDTLTTYGINDTYYLVEVYDSGAKIYGAPFKIVGTSFNLNSAAPLTLTPPSGSLGTWFLPLTGGTVTGTLNVTGQANLNGSPICALNNCPGLANEQVAFTNSTSATLTTSYTASNLVWSCWDGSTPANSLTPSNVTLNTSTLVLTFSFSSPKTGFCAVNGTGGTPFPGSIYVDVSSSQTVAGNKIFTGSEKFGSVNGVCIVDGVVNPTLASAVACAGTTGVVEIPMLYIAPMTANVTIPAGVTLRFDGPSCITTTGYTLTINGPLIAPPVRIFCGSGTVVLGSRVTTAPVEWFGAVGDWNGSTGTDNTAAIQNCLNALTSGECVFQTQSYQTTSALSITKPAIGIRGVNSLHPSGAIVTIPALSAIVCTSASADILDISGVSTGNSLYGNTVKDITLARSVVPSGTAKGLSLSFSYKAQISNVVSLDSIYNFYFRGVGSMGSGYIENNIASWGYNGITETSGSVYGFYVDATGGVFSPSIRIRNNHVASNVGAGVTTYGYANVGTLGADWHLTHDETAGLNYGIYLNNSGSGFTASSDIQIVDPVMDGCLTACVYITGLSGGVGISGGWLNPVGANAIAADFESGVAGSQVSMVNVSVYGTGITGFLGVIIGHNSYNVHLIGNKIQTAASSSPVISFSGVTAGAISGNSIWSSAGTTTLINLVSTINVPISSNTLNGNSTNGIVLDSATHGISGLETNTCGASVAVIPNCIVDNGGNMATFGSGILLSPVAFASLPTCVAGLEGLSRAVNNSNTSTYNATVAGGGTNHIVAYCNGTNWVAH